MAMYDKEKDDKIDMIDDGEFVAWMKQIEKNAIKQKNWKRKKTAKNKEKGSLLFAEGFSYKTKNFQPQNFKYCIK